VPASKRGIAAAPAGNFISLGRSLSELYRRFPTRDTQLGEVRYEAGEGDGALNKSVGNAGFSQQGQRH